MAVRFRIGQASRPLGQADQSRHDLVAGEQIQLAAVEPVPAPGVTFQWELLDRVGTSAGLLAATGSSVAIAAPSARPFAFLVELRAYNNGTFTGSSKRIASGRTVAKNLRLPLFGETADGTSKLAQTKPTASTDNADYSDLGGTGVSGPNWRGFAEAYRELVMAVESGSAAGGDATGAVSALTVTGLQGRAVVNTPPQAGEVLSWIVGTGWSPLAPVVPQQPGWLTAIDIDFTALPTQTLVNGANTIADKPWFGENIAAKSTLFEITNGAGLRVKNNALSTFLTPAERSGPLIKVRLSDLIPNYSLDMELMIWVVFDVVNALNAAEQMLFILDTYAFTVNQAQHVRAMRYNNTGPQARDFAMMMGSVTGFGSKSIAITETLQVVHVKEIVRGVGAVYSKAVGMAAGLTLPARADLNTWGSYDLSNNTAARFASSYMTAATVPAIILGTATNNTLNNQTFVGTVNRLRVDYKK